MFYALALISVIMVMILLKTIVEILPSMLACLIRWKENINIEASVRLSRDRDFSTVAMVLPFCLTIFRFRIYDPAFISNLSDPIRLWAIIGIFGIYALIRKAATMLVHPRRMQQKALAATEKSANTYFIFLTLVLLAVGGLSSFLDMSLHAIRLTSLWLSALIYGLYLVRKVQIFASSCSLFAAFLYLCALEILPTGILVVSDVIF